MQNVRISPTKQEPPARMRTGGPLQSAACEGSSNALDWVIGRIQKTLRGFLKIFIT